MPKKKFEELCSGKIGYALDSPFRTYIENETISEATKIVGQQIKELFESIEKSAKKEIVEFYIGKSHIRKRARGVFNPKQSGTWKLDHGINARYSDHVGNSYGKNGLVVVAVVDAKSIPDDCKVDGYITHQEEYALILERRLIQKFQKDDKWGSMLANKGTDPGRSDGQRSKGYVVYIAFALAGKCPLASFWKVWHENFRYYRSHHSIAIIV